jgi:hypothetical protein
MRDAIAQPENPVTFFECQNLNVKELGCWEYPELEGLCRLVAWK